MSAQCKSCGAAIRWGVTTLGAPIPLDPSMVVDGNVAVIGHAYDAEARKGTPLVTVVPRRTLDLARQHGTVVLHRSHFATCPDAEQWRRKHEREGT